MNIGLSNIRFNNTLPFKSTVLPATAHPSFKYETNSVPVHVESEIRTNPAQLSLLHMHDFHGQNIRMERAYSAVRQFDNNALQNQNSVFNKNMPIDKLKLCSGDMFLGGNPAELAVVNEFLNISGVLANAVGNHECDSETENFADIVKNRNYRFIGTNMHPSGDNKINSILSNSFIAEVHGNKYGVIGLAPLDMRDHVKNQNAVDRFNISDIENSIENVKEDIAQLKEYGVNKIIVLSHMGLEKDQYLAQNVSDIDVILGGHSHNKLKEVKEGENLFYSPKGEPVLIMQVGRDGEYIGMPNLKFNELGQITDIQYNVIKTDNFERDYAAKTDFEEILGKPEVVGRVSKVEDEGENIYIYENPHCNFITDSLRAELGTDIAVMNSANARSRFYKGDVTPRDLRLITPFANKIAIIELSEEELVNRLNHLVSESLKSQDNRPGIMQVSGLRYTYSKAQGKLTELYFVDNNGKETAINLEHPNKDKLYTVAADDFCIASDYAGLDAKHRLNNAITIFDYDKDKFVADHMKKQTEPFEIKSDGRIKVVD